MCRGLREPDAENSVDSTRRNVSYPSTAADVRKDGRIAKAIARQCATSRTAGSLPYMTTANTARDMDRIREALGERKISYLGASYGTYLGAVYTTLFPQRSDRFVLDSSLGPGGYDYTAQRRFGHGLEERFPDFAKFAAANPQYGLGSTPKQIRATFFDLARRLEKTRCKESTGRGSAVSRSRASTATWACPPGPSSGRPSTRTSPHRPTRPRRTWTISSPVDARRPHSCVPRPLSEAHRDFRSAHSHPHPGLDHEGRQCGHPTMTAGTNLGPSPLWLMTLAF